MRNHPDPSDGDTRETTTGDWLVLARAAFLGVAAVGMVVVSVMSHRVCRA